MPTIDGYVTKLIKKTDSSVQFRINLKSETEFIEWKTKFCAQNSINLNVLKSKEFTYHLTFLQNLICHHGNSDRHAYQKHYVTRTGLVP